MSEFKLQKPVNTFKEEMVNFYVTLQLDSLNILMQSDKLIRFYNFYGKNIGNCINKKKNIIIYKLCQN